MPEIDLGQHEADLLMRMPKVKVSDKAYDFPSGGGALTVPIESQDHRESFLLDISQARINLNKIKYQTRGRQIFVLARIDLDGGPHRNPDGEIVECPHIHLYREGYGDKWAFSFSTADFPAYKNAWTTLQDFIEFCNVVEPPHIVRGLF